MNKFKGMGVAMVTPFTEDGSLDKSSLEKLCRHLIEGGADFLVVMGTTGENPTISNAEQAEILSIIQEENKGSKPIVFGIGGNNTAAVVERLKTTNLDGVDGILSVSPYYNKPNQEGIFRHFEAISDHSPLPVIMYNVPGRTSANMLPETTLRLARDFENIIAVKEAGNNMSQYLWLLKDKPDDFMIISGDDDLALPVTLAGGSGVISVLGQAFPKDFTRMIHLGLNGKALESYRLHFKLMEITSLIFAENNPAGIKAVLNIMNLCNDTVRLPLVRATESLKSKMRTFIDDYK